MALHAPDDRLPDAAAVGRQVGCVEAGPAVAHEHLEAAVAGLGVYHSSEIPLVFGTFDAATATDTETRLSAAMMGAWAAFAQDPWGAGPGWERVRANGSYGVAALGGPANLTGWSVVENGTLDANCWIYGGIYEKGKGNTTWW